MFDSWIECCMEGIEKFFIYGYRFEVFWMLYMENLFGIIGCNVYIILMKEFEVC